MKCITAIHKLIDTMQRNSASRSSNDITSTGYEDGMDAAQKEQCEKLFGEMWHENQAPPPYCKPAHCFH
jgi:hypothetical protein